MFIIILFKIRCLSCCHNFGGMFYFDFTNTVDDYLNKANMDFARVD